MMWNRTWRILGNILGPPWRGDRYLKPTLAASVTSLTKKSADPTTLEVHLRPLTQGAGRAERERNLGNSFAEGAQETPGSKDERAEAGENDGQGKGEAETMRTEVAVSKAPFLHPSSLREEKSIAERLSPPTPV